VWLNFWRIGPAVPRVRCPRKQAGCKPDKVRLRESLKPTQAPTKSRINNQTGRSEPARKAEKRRKKG
jgi:hypothetical protein